MSSGGKGTYSILVQLDANQAISTMNSLKTQLGGLGASFKTSSSSVNQTAMSFERYTQSAQKAVGANSSLATNFSIVRNAVGSLNSQIATTAKALPQLANAEMQAAHATNQLNTAVQNKIQSISHLASRIGGISFLMGGFVASMGEAQGMAELLEVSEAKVTEQTAELEEAIRKYGEGSNQATQAQEGLTGAQRAYSFQARVTRLSQQDQIFYLLSFASIAAGPVISAITKLRLENVSLTKSFTNFTSKITGGITPALQGAVGILNRFSPIIKGTIPVMGAAAASTAANATALSTYTVATGAATTATGGFRAAILALTASMATNPIFLAIIAITTAFVALQQNLFGVTDRLREFGIAIGQAIPVLQPILNLLDAIGASIGITGEATVDATAQFQEAAEGFENIGTLWHNTLAGMQQSESEIVRFFGNLGVLVSDGLVAAGDAITQFGADLLQGFMEWGAAVQQGAQLIANGFMNIPNLLSDIGTQSISALGINKLDQLIQGNPVLKQMADEIGGFVDFIEDKRLEILEKLGITKLADDIANTSIAGLVAKGDFGTKEGDIGDLGARPLQKIPDQIVNERSRQEGLTPPGVLAATKMPFTATLQQTRDELASIGKEAETVWINYITHIGQAGTSTELFTANLKNMVEEERLSQDAADILTEAHKVFTQEIENGASTSQASGEAMKVLTNTYKEQGVEIEKVETVISKLRDSNTELSTEIKQTSDVIRDGTLVKELEKQATLEVNQAVLEYGQEIVKNRTYLEEWGQIIDSNIFKAAAFEKGQQDQIAALQKAKVAVLENAGALSEYVSQIESGEMLQVAFTRGVQEQSRSLYEGLEALAETQGMLETYAEQLERGEIQSLEFARGQQEVGRALGDSIVEMERMAGALQQLDIGLANGVQQQVAFHTGLLEGRQAARDWVLEMERATGQFVGMQRGMEEVATLLGRDIPDAWSQNTERMQHWLGVAEGFAPQVTELANSFLELGANLKDMMEIDFDDFGKDIDDAIEDIEDQFDDLADELNLDEDHALIIQMRGELESEQLLGEIQKLGPLITKTITLKNREGQEAVSEYISEVVREGTEDATPEVQAQGERIITAINTAFYTSTIGGEAFRGSIQGLMDELTGAGMEADEAAQFIHDLGVKEENTAIQTDALAEAMGTFEFRTAAASEAVGELISNISQVTGLEISDLSTRSEGNLQAIQAQIADVERRGGQIIGGQMVQQPTGPPGIFNAGMTPGTGGEGPMIDTAPAKAAMDELLAYATNIMNQIAQTGQHVSTVWGGHFNTATQNAAGMMNQLIAHAINIMNQVAETANFVAISWTTHFNTAVQNAAGVLNQLITHAINIMNQVAQTAQFVATSFTTHFNTAAQNAAGSLNQLLSHTQTQMATIAQTAVQVAVAFTQQFEQGAQNAAGSINSLTSHIQTKVSQMVSALGQVTQAFNDIGAAANSAAGEVDDLTTAINNVPTEHTITFNVQVTGDSIPSGGSLSAAGGLGRYGGVDYLPLASGSGGISGLGFDPILIDHPTNILVGESGPELVAVTPLNNNGVGRTGEKSPFGNLRLAGGSDEMFSQGNTAGIMIQTQSVVFDQNQGPIQIMQAASIGSGKLENVGIPTTGSGGFTGNNVGLGTGQGGIFSANQPLQESHAFQPVLNDQGMIKAMETLVEWFKFLGLNTGASVPGSGNFTPGTKGNGAFASAGMGAFAGQISMQGGQIMFDSNQGDMELQTSTGAISIAGNGGAFARAGDTIASVGNVGLFGTQENPQLTQLNRTMQDVNGSMQAVGDAMAQVGDEIVMGNEQTQQTFQGLTTTTEQGLQNVVNGVNLFGAGNQVGFQQFPGGGAVGAGGAAGNPLGFLSNTFNQLGLQLPAGIPSSGGTVSPGTGSAGGGISTGGTGCNVCGAASGLGNAASDLSGAAGQLGNTINQIPTGGTGTTGMPTTNPTNPTGGGTGGMNNGTQPGTGSGCSCSCMPMDSDPNRYKIEDGSGNDCNDHIYFDSVEECHSRLNEICPGENTNNPAPTNPIPTTPPTNPTQGTGAMFPPGVSVSGPGAIACINGQCFGSNGPIGGQQVGQIPGVGQQPIGTPPEPPQIVQQAGLPSQAPNVNQDPTSWTIVESAGAVGTYDIIDDSGDVVQLGFRTLSAAETYLNYFISYYQWVESGSTGIPGPVPVGGSGGTGGMGTGTGGIIAGTGGGVQAIAGGGGAFAEAGNAIAQAGNFLGSGLGMGNGGSSEKKIGSIPVLESIPRAQGPFRSGQDNMEPIYDNSGVKIGSSTMGSRMDSGTTDKDEDETGSSTKPRFVNRVQRHLDTALAIAGGYGELKNAIVDAIQDAFGDIMLNLTVNSMLDGNAIHKNQNKYQVKKVSLYA